MCTDKLGLGRFRNSGSVAVFGWTALALAVGSVFEVGRDLNAALFHVSDGGFPEELGTLQPQPFAGPIDFGDQFKVGIEADELRVFVMRSGHG